MVLDIIEFIGVKLKALNPFINQFATNCIKLPNGQVVNFIGEEKTDFGFTDIVAVGAYARINPQIKYVDRKALTSCDNKQRAQMEFKLVLYSVGQIKKLHPVKLENKIKADINNLDLKKYLGPESEIEINVLDSNLDYYDNFLKEVGKNLQIARDATIICLNCQLLFTESDDNCGTCNVYENEEECAPIIECEEFDGLWDTIDDNTDVIFISDLE